MRERERERDFLGPLFGRCCVCVCVCVCVVCVFVLHVHVFESLCIFLKNKNRKDITPENVTKRWEEFLNVTPLAASVLAGAAAEACSAASASTRSEACRGMPLLPAARAPASTSKCCIEAKSTMSRRRRRTPPLCCSLISTGSRSITERVAPPCTRVSMRECKRDTERYVCL